MAFEPGEKAMETGVGLLWKTVREAAMGRSGDDVAKSAWEAIERSFAASVDGAAVAFIAVMGSTPTRDASALAQMLHSLLDRPEVAAQLGALLLDGKPLDPAALYGSYRKAGWNDEFLNQADLAMLLTFLNGIHCPKAPGADVREQLQSVREALALLTTAVEAPAQAPTSVGTSARETYLRLLVEETGRLPLSGPEKSGSDATSTSAPPSLSDVYIGLRVAGRRRTESGRLGRRDESPTALEAFAVSPHLLLIGEPGGGKSTFANHLVNTLARKQLDPALDLAAALPGLPPGWEALLPVRVMLRQVAEWVRTSGTRTSKVGLLAAYLDSSLAKECPDAVADVRLAVTVHKALIVLDGWDEVADGDPALPAIRDMLNALPTAYPSMPILATCRVRSYEERDRLDASRGPWQLDEVVWRRADLLRFDSQQIEDFVTAWYRTLDQRRTRPAWHADAAKLTAATRRADLSDMAGNPLLLTIMAIDHADKGELPDARSQVYEDVVDLLLWKWREKDKTRQDGHDSLRDLLRNADRQEVDFRRVLARVAYEAHAGAEAAGTQSAADIPEAVLREAFVALTRDGRDYTWADRVLRLVTLRAGLLIPGKGGCCTFPHRTFQEYLAACHVCSQGEVVAELDGLARRGAYWREVALLAVNRLVYIQADFDRPMRLVGKLCPLSASTDEAGWRAVVMGGECMAEIGARRATDEQDALVLKRVRDRLVQILEDVPERLPTVERIGAGNTLAAIGDPRDLRAMVEVPGGPFLYGPNREQADLPSFRIRKYPVTVGEYRAYVEANPRVKMPPAPLWGWIDSHPMVNVSWLDAKAFCEWAGLALPSERQWEKAARGTDGREYPWGDDWRDGHCACSVQPADLNSTAPVGAFTAGESPYSCSDMVGNVWEWCQDPYERGSSYRVLRGGSWYYVNADDFRAHCRRGSDPDNRGNSRGFRCVSPEGSS